MDEPTTSKPVWADRARATGNVVWTREDGWLDQATADDTPDECGCSEDYGPCEEHSTQLAQREGASTRTADALALVFLMDTRDMLIGHANAVDAIDRLTRDIDTALSWKWSGNAGSGDAGDGWIEEALEDGWTRAEELQDAVMRAESDLTMIGASTYWDDGYRILVMSDDCPLIADYDAPARDMDEAYEEAAAEYRPMECPSGGPDHRAGIIGRKTCASCDYGMTN